MKLKGGGLILILLLSGFFCCLSLHASGLVNINSAGLEELDSLPGIGPVKAQAIIDYRSANGNFLTKEDIMLVLGIGETTFNNLKDLITVGEDAEAAPPVAAEECGNGAIAGGEECDDGNKTDNDGCDSACKLEHNTEETAAGQETGVPEAGNNEYRLGDIVINEFVSDPADNEVEWIELYNNSGIVIDLAGWIIEDGSGAKTALAGAIGKSGNEKYFVLEKPKGNLNNTGDAIILRYEDKLIDTVSYGKWDNGDSGNNAPMAGDPFSVARKLDGHNTYCNKNDFSLTTAPTKKSKNIIASPEPAEDELSGNDRINYDFSENIIISEIFPNPAGSDTEEEFIELYNTGEEDIDLSEWKLGDESSRKYAIKNSQDDSSFSTIIKAKGYWVIKRGRTKIALNNSSDFVMLYQPFIDKPLVNVRYEKSFENQSYNYLENNKYVWSEIISPGQANIIKAVNHAPDAAFDCPAEADLGKPIIFDSSDTVDDDGDKLFYFWDFGDGATNTLAIAEHTYFKAGVFTVILKISDGEMEAQKEKIIKIGAADMISAVNEEISDYDIVINEIMPNPEGSDSEEEWIEIYNRGGTRINMLDWRVDDMEGGSKPYIFKNEFMLEAGKYFLLERTESNLSLNNSDDMARLFNPVGEKVDEVFYGKTAQGEAYARGANDKWFWTTAATPVEENIIKIADSKMAQDANGVIVKGVSMQNAGIQAEESFILTALEKINELETGDKVRVAGTVAVLPGILGAQYFYIVGSPGIQVYNYKKDFPKLKIGDYIEVQGELAESGGERRIKTKIAADMRIIEHKQAPQALVETCEKINEEYVGRLVSVSGEVVDRKSATVFMDDGTGEIKVYIKTASGINPAELAEGESYSITGIVGQTAAGIRLLPRGTGDVVRKNTIASGTSAVLGEIIAADEWELAARDKKLELFKYLLAGCFGLTIILGGALVRLKRG